MALRIEWTEMNGPLVSVPQATGFGTVLVERRLESLNGTTKSNSLPGEVGGSAIIGEKSA
jgi:two-component sensor histidine kinase